MTVTLHCQIIFVLHQHPVLPKNTILHHIDPNYITIHVATMMLFWCFQKSMVLYPPNHPLKKSGFPLFSPSIIGGKPLFQRNSGEAGEALAQRW